MGDGDDKGAAGGATGATGATGGDGAGADGKGNTDAGKGNTLDLGTGNILDGDTPGGDGATGAGAAADGKGKANGDGTKGAWPDNWRDEMAGGNEKALGVLKRFSSPVAVGTALLNARQKLSEGALRAGLPENASEAQVAEFRKANNIPEKAEGYLEKLPEGVKITDADKPLMENFAKTMHGLNAPPQYVSAAIQSFYEQRQATIERISEANEQQREEGTEALMQEWGGNFQANKNAVAGFIKSMPEEAQGIILTARDANGILILNHPSVMKALCAAALEINPAATIAPGSSADGAKGLTTEIETIERTMRETPDKYWKGAEGERMQARYRELLTARDRIAKR